MQGLVGDLLTLAKMDEEEAAAQSGAARPALEEVDLSDVIEGEVLAVRIGGVRTWREAGIAGGARYRAAR